MNVLKGLVVLAVAFGAYHWWHKHQTQSTADDAQASSQEAGTGFVYFPRPSNTSMGVVLIYAPAHCPSATARRASALAQRLEELDIPHAVLQEATFDVDGSDQAVMARIKSVMEGDGPPVFVRGRAKANPSIDEVVAEYRRSH